MSNKNYISELSESEIKASATLTPKEQSAVNAFIAAAKALPKSICIEVDGNDWGEPNLLVSKRITSYSTQQVASLHKKSLCF
jgi:hypothetical protein